MTGPTSVNRADFIQRLMRDCGLTYVESCRAYDCFISVFEDAVLSGHRINVGRVGAITPIWQSARTYNMGFKRQKPTADNPAGVVLQKSEINMGARIRYKFRLHRAFVRQNQLRWMC